MRLEGRSLLRWLIISTSAARAAAYAVLVFRATATSYYAVCLCASSYGRLRCRLIMPFVSESGRTGIFYSRTHICTYGVGTRLAARSYRAGRLVALLLPAEELQLPAPLSAFEANIFRPFENMKFSSSHQTTLLRCLLDRSGVHYFRTRTCVRISH